MLNMATRIVQGGFSKGQFALIPMRLQKCNTGPQVNGARNYSSSSSNDMTDNNSNDLKGVTDDSIKKSVFISQSYDVFTNLALEDWLYKNFDFSHHHLLMLWANDPCVVIGRHQNPFIEANVSNLMRKGITLARRNSGGGAVYHDRGNLNCTFFTPRERYNRKYNLNIITRALFREWGIKSDISDRDDIVISGKKISGTAAKLGQPNAYHHCTLLVNSNKLHLSDALAKDEVNIISKATSSVRSPIKNLCDVNRAVNVPQLLSAIGYEFLRTSATELEDGGRDQAMKQRGFQLINPTEKWFPGLTEIREMFASWDWRLGKTPKFTVQKELEMKAEDKEHKVLLSLDVEKGIITNITLTLPTNDVVPVVSNLLNQPYTEDSLHGMMDALKLVPSSDMKQAMSGL
ncbi:unnamed protein product [Hermetia illucens]|uniref:BPL/LPL catalytic domain-containing protein n=1 Tax=Hermetia illucens TaxID=343691 RepID=A0A7R8YWL4_HERIL|nr:lipoyltransferase 1, mitochondrial [Hermetia illucens]CAD7088538.1 unnamed protein product [Hermetia illucens]